VVAHSIGGLIARYYIQNVMPHDPDDFRPQISHLVMLGTPNQGSPCADLMDSAFQLAGKNVEALRQLRTDVVNRFNGVVFNHKGVKFSALAGNPLPMMCYKNEVNDGFVHVSSAIYRVKDNARTGSIHTDMTGTSDFSSFVKPHLAIGPKGDHNPVPPDTPSGFGQTNQNRFGAFFVNAAYKPAENLTGENDIKPDFAKSVRIAAKGSIEVEIPVEAALNFGLTFMASNEVSATLFNDKGLIAGKNLTKTPEANAWFRSIYFDKAVTAGTWKLKLENTSDHELEAIIATWKDAVK
jgi:hypothetical protein